MIPRRFFRLFDVLMPGVTFLTAYAAVSVLHTLLEPARTRSIGVSVLAGPRPPLNAGVFGAFFAVARLMYNLS